LRTDELERRIAALPLWSGRPTLVPLKGGISNVSFTATDATGKYVVRITRDFPFHHVFRNREVMSARAAHALGFAPEVVHAEPGLMVSRYIEGAVLTADDIAPRIDSIVPMLKRFHREMTGALNGPGFIFWVFHVNRDYVRQLSGATDADRQHWLAVNDELEAAQHAMPIVVGHHDLLPANLIDDGSRLWLIDYEYAGFGTAMFDLANLSSNSGFSPNQSEGLLAAYFGAVDDTILRAHAAMEAASLLREALWALVSIPHLGSNGFDYAGYARDNFVRLEARLASYRERFG
jgi:thiamine kinase-like enzyme